MTKTNGHHPNGTASKHPALVWTDHQPWRTEDVPLPDPAPGAFFTDFTRVDAEAWCARVQDWVGDVVVLSGGGGSHALLADLLAVHPTPAYHTPMDPERAARFGSKCTGCATGLGHYAPHLWTIRPVLRLFQQGPHGPDDWVRTPLLGSWKLRRYVTDEGRPLAASILREALEAERAARDAKKPAKKERAP